MKRVLATPVLPATTAFATPSGEKTTVRADALENNSRLHTDVHRGPDRTVGEAQGATSRRSCPTPA